MSACWHLLALDVPDEAVKSLSTEYGWIGAVLAIILVAFLALVAMYWRTSSQALGKKDGIIDNKDKEIARLNEQRVEAALKAVEAINTVSQKLDRQHETQERLVEAFERYASRDRDRRD